MKSKDMLLLLFFGVLLWCLTFELFIMKNVGKFLNMFHGFDASTDIKNFFNKAPVLQERLFLVDRNLLKVLQKPSSASDDKREHLVFRGNDFKMITLALLYPANASLQENVLLPILKAWEIGFWVETIISSKPSKLSMYANLPLGFILRKGDGALVIEIVLFHEREGDFWWHGSFNHDAHYEIKLTNLNMLDKKQEFALSEEAAIDKFQMKTVSVDGITLNVPKNISLFLRQETKFCECNYDGADRYYRTYGKDTTPLALKFVHKARKVLVQAKYILDELQVPFWISSGTLLGYYRQCDVIPYSRDVDIAVFGKHYREEILDKFRASKFTLKYIFGQVGDGYELSFYLSSIKLDIFFFYDDGYNYWNSGHYIKKLNATEYVAEKYKFSFPKFTLCWTEFLELKVRIPCETEAYIRANYGPDWFTPVPRWDGAENAFNAKKVGEWRNDDIAQVMKMY